MPDLVLLDVMLPDESGYDIVRKLRKILRQEIAGHYGDGKDRRNGYDQRSGRRGR